LKIHIVPFTLSNKLNLEPITSPRKKKARTRSRTLIAKQRMMRRRHVWRRLEVEMKKYKLPHDMLTLKKNLD
jgi:hypothetical protein